ncbi:fatty acid desaturase [Pararobbsia silviterrae]|uniref:Fatty acid desaturase n=1 Tax=Pararobbsia silviterrae TaxID=1792498 RepID=A0A494XDT3_9BURK|nr:fatty acid desaturase [Pararobbsia silviterrae]RKP47831.1 fatty acid desaturase [Pararobbsia silviterrae]
MNLTPLSIDEPLPHRKIIRSWLIPLNIRSTSHALALALFDYVLLFVLLAGVVVFQSVLAKLACALSAGFVTGRLFIIGHDACHQSLTVHRRLNKWIGRITFLPSLTPYSLWDVGHNVVHHGFTNLKGTDFVWAPLTQAEYDALPAHRRLLERLYRCGFGSGLYYLYEMWWRKMLFPNRREMPTRRRIFVLDGLLVCAYGAVWIAALVALAHTTHQSAALLVGLGFVVPFLFWCTMMGFVVYVHHTHRDVSWYTSREEWARSQPFVSTTVHLTFPYGIGSLLHHIMEHTAHHVDMSIPLYRLREAQKRLEQMLPGRIIIQRFSWRWYWDTVRHCKLYDFERRIWTDFKGRVPVERHA